MHIKTYHFHQNLLLYGKLWSMTTHSLIIQYFLILANLQISIKLRKRSTVLTKRFSRLKSYNLYSISRLLASPQFSILDAVICQSNLVTATVRIGNPQFTRSMYSLVIFRMPVQYSITNNIEG